MVFPPVGLAPPLFFTIGIPGGGVESSGKLKATRTEADLILCGRSRLRRQHAPPIRRMGREKRFLID